jgi:hypothetical protein
MLFLFVFQKHTCDSNFDTYSNELFLQGTDPATDFRAMGIVALKHLIYFAKKYTKTMTSIIEARQDDASFYPVAVAGINISKMMFDLFSNIDDANSKLLQILFDHENALEEVLLFLVTCSTTSFTTNQLLCVFIERFLLLK